MIKFVCLFAKRLLEIFHPFSFVCNILCNYSGGRVKLFFQELKGTVRRLVNGALAS